MLRPKEIFLRFLKEPYAHFLLSGLTLYGIYTTLNPPVSKTPLKKIDVVFSDIQAQKDGFAQTWKRTPRVKEAALFEKEKFFEEVLLDEALRLQLARQDTQIREKLITKMKLLLTQGDTFDEPSEEELFAYYQSHIDRYAPTRKLTFWQVFYPTFAPNEIEKWIVWFDLFDVPAVDAASFGEVFEGGSRFEHQSYGEIERRFGVYFAKAVWEAREGVWFGPIRSKEGMHAVYIDSREHGAAEAFEAVQERVYRDFTEERKRIAFKEAWRKLSAQYAPPEQER